ncbi:MAG: hypothetical protein ACSHYB_05310 [Roseibacillus sp.]
MGLAIELLDDERSRPVLQEPSFKKIVDELTLGGSGKGHDYFVAETPERALSDKRVGCSLVLWLRFWLVAVPGEQSQYLLLPGARLKDMGSPVESSKNVAVLFETVELDFDLKNMGLEELDVLATDLVSKFEQLGFFVLKNELLSCLSLLTFPSRGEDESYQRGGSLRPLWEADWRLFPPFMKKQHQVTGEYPCHLMLESPEVIANTFADGHFPLNLDSDQVMRVEVRSEELCVLVPNLYQLQILGGVVVVEGAVARKPWNRASISIRIEAGEKHPLTLPQERISYGFALPKEMALSELPESLFKEVAILVWHRFLQTGRGISEGVLESLLAEVRTQLGAAKIPEKRGSDLPDGSEPQVEGGSHD